MNYIRSDIIYYVRKLSIFTNNPSMNCQKVINKILKYLKYTMDYDLYYAGTRQ